MLDIILYKKVSLDEPQYLIWSIDEFRTELYDDKINLLGLAPPKMVDYLSFRDNYVEWPKGGHNFEVDFRLSRKVTSQKRVVYDVFMLFGDVGGLHDFISLILAPIFGMFSTRLLSAYLVQKLYRGVY